MDGEGFPQEEETVVCWGRARGWVRESWSRLREGLEDSGWDEMRKASGGWTVEGFAYPAKTTESDSEGTEAWTEATNHCPLVLGH